MHFRHLQIGLIGALKARLRSGDLTERRIARLTGISQPHIHNVLNGTRVLSPEIADRILDRFRIPLAELLPSEEVRPRGCSGCHATRNWREVPVLEGWVGPGMPLPRLASTVERYPFPASALAPLVNPAVARLAPDTRMAGVLSDNDLVLLDHGREARSEIRDDGLYLLNRRGEGLVRRLRSQGNRLFIVAEDVRDQPNRWEAVSLASHHVLDIVRGRLVWIGRNLRKE